MDQRQIDQLLTVSSSANELQRRADHLYVTNDIRRQENVLNDPHEKGNDADAAKKLMDLRSEEASRHQAVDDRINKNISDEKDFIEQENDGHRNDERFRELKDRLDGNLRIAEEKLQATQDLQKTLRERAEELDIHNRH